MEDPGKLTYELPSTNINQVTLEHQYTRSMIENTTHTSLLFFFFIFFFLHIYKCACFEHKQKSSKDEVKNEQTLSNAKLA